MKFERAPCWEKRQGRAGEVNGPNDGARLGAAGSNTRRLWLFGPRRGLAVSRALNAAKGVSDPHLGAAPTGCGVAGKLGRWGYGEGRGGGRGGEARGGRGGKHGHMGWKPEAALGETHGPIIDKVLYCTE